MKSDALKVLVLCTGNSCRSIMAEALINDLGRGRYRAWSAGSVPAGSVHPKSIETLLRHGMDPGQPRSKSWDEFAEEPFDLVITVCDQAAGESCPRFPGNPKKLHWSTPDPTKAIGSEGDIDAAFDKAFFMLKNRVEDVLPHLISRQPVFPCCPSISAENSGVIEDSCLRGSLCTTSLILCSEIHCCLPSRSLRTDFAEFPAFPMATFPCPSFKWGTTLKSHFDQLPSVFPSVPEITSVG